MLPQYSRKSFDGGIFIFIGLDSFTVSSSANLLTDQPLLRYLGWSRWYWARLGFNVLHFAFVPLVAYSVRNIIEDRSKGHSIEDLGRCRWPKSRLQMRDRAIQFGSIPERLVNSEARCVNGVGLNPRKSRSFRATIKNEEWI